MVHAQVRWRADTFGLELQSGRAVAFGSHREHARRSIELPAALEVLKNSHRRNWAGHVVLVQWAGACLALAVEPWTAQNVIAPEAAPLSCSRVRAAGARCSSSGQPCVTFTLATGKAPPVPAPRAERCERDQTPACEGLPLTEAPARLFERCWPE